MKRHSEKLLQHYPPSEPCCCTVCVQYCRRPGWWTVRECIKAIEAGLGNRMMLELSPDRTFGVLAPAFAGNEGMFALQEYSYGWCTFLKNDRCRLFGTALQPLECRFCHHTRNGKGLRCHLAIAADWNTGAGKRLVERWMRATGHSVKRNAFVGLRASRS